MAARKGLSESLASVKQEAAFSPDAQEHFTYTAMEALRQGKGLEHIAKTVAERGNTAGNREASRKLSESKQKVGRPPKGLNLRVVSLRLPVDVDDALEEIAREREAAHEWPWAKWEIVAESVRQFIQQHRKRRHG